MAPSQIRKRDGSLVSFDCCKIAAAIARALQPGERALASAAELAQAVTGALETRSPDAPPEVEAVQDAVEEALIARGLPRSAKAYILYRQKRAELRQAKRLLGVEDGLKLSLNAAHLLRQRYLLRNERGQATESAVGLFQRVARTVAAAEPAAGRAEWEERFFRLLTSLDFLPNSPTLMNAGTPMGQLAACYVIPVEDSIPGIFDALKAMALVHQSGGGTGFSFSRLRSRGALVRSTMGQASGPLSFMSLFDATTGVIRQGGRRRGANMAILRCDHPDILEFIAAKEREGALSNFNLSVGVTDDFMRTLAVDAAITLRDPRDGKPRGELAAREIFGRLVAAAWSSGDPGVVFLDAINRDHPTPLLGPLEATNPCGEQPLLPWESCNLGSINLRQMVQGGHLDEGRLRRTIELAVRFLDDVITVNRYPLEACRRISEGNRKIGLGVMGFAEALIALGIPYDSEQALEQADRIGAILQETSHRASAALAAERGPFPNYRGSTWEARGIPLRNATTTTIAPTGTISLLAGCSSGIEPLFAVAYLRTLAEGTRLLETTPLFEELSRARGLLNEDLLARIARRGTVQDLPELPADLRRLFVTALDLAPEWHVRLQAAFQRHCDNAVSKTINFPAGATRSQVADAYRLAHQLGCKGITVYRYGSKREQVLQLGAGDTGGEALTTVEGEYAGGCPGERCPV